MNLRFAVAVLIVVAGASTAYGGEHYTITSSDGKTSYEVYFGGGKAGYSLVAFDPEAKQFVYLPVKDQESRPKPVAKICNPKTGEIMPLYKFPKVEQPLPEIASIKELVYFPLTNSKDFKVKLTGNTD